MTNQDLIIDIARFGLENDRENLQSTLTRFIHEYENLASFSGLGAFSGQFTEKVT